MAAAYETERIAEEGQPSLEEMRSRFDGNVRHCRLSFDEIYLRLEDAACAIGTVAQDAGISRQGMWELYNAYFKPFFGYSGLERRDIRMATRLRERAQKRLCIEEAPAPNRSLRLIAERARAHGSVVKNVVVENGGRLQASKKLLMIDGRVTALRHITAVFKYPEEKKPSYSFATVSRSQLSLSDDIVVILETGGTPPRFFVVSTTILRKRLFADGTVKTTTLYMRQHNGQRKKMKLDLLDFEDDW